MLSMLGPQTNHGVGKRSEVEMERYVRTMELTEPTSEKLDFSGDLSECQKFPSARLCAIILEVVPSPRGEKNSLEILRLVMGLALGAGKSAIAHGGLAQRLIAGPHHHGTS